MNQRVKGVLTWGGFLLIIFVFCRKNSFLTTLLWILGWQGFVGVIDWLVGRKIRRTRDDSCTETTEADPRFDTPRKKFVVFINYHVSNLLFLFNPILQMQSTLQMA